jgi:sugar lactone lactonase YvrE
MGIKFHAFSETSTLVLKRHQFPAQRVPKPAFQGEIELA